MTGGGEFADVDRFVEVQPLFAARIFETWIFVAPGIGLVIRKLARPSVSFGISLDILCASDFQVWFLIL